MALVQGTRIGVYEIVSAIGAGGMGEVYRARDTKLNRDVALKVLPALSALDADRVARLTREAHALASLNHPNIATIHGLEDSPSPASGRANVLALVLELVEGPTLAERLSSSVDGGPIPVRDALTIAQQIAEALEAAHEQGIVHRDLKPANVKIRPDGRVKVLDFGLAKLLDPPGNSSAAGAIAVTASPTLISPVMTQVGIIVGTAAYMSPEQARGRAADRRSDVWAFGCVLFEMLSGTRPFPGDEVPDVLAAILQREPAWEALPATTPPSIRRLLARCLDKNPRRRLHDVADARIEIEDALAPSSASDAERSHTRRPRFGARSFAAAAIIAVVGASIGWYLRPRASDDATAARVVRLQITPSELLEEADGVLALSPDGARVVYAAGAPGRTQLYLREIDQFESKAIPGTERAVDATFSPDGQSLAFVADRKLKRLALAGGSPRTLRELVDGPGLAWTADETILFNPGTATGVWRIPIDGGEATALTATTGGRDNMHRFPQMLPGGKSLLYSAQGGVSDDRVFAQSLATKQQRPIVKGTAPHYLPTGHLAYVDAGTLYAVRFDPERLETVGSPVALVEGIRQTHSGSTLISFSTNGSIVYVPSTAGPQSNTLVWVDRNGTEQPTGASSRPYAQPRLSPDARRVVTALRGDDEDLWIYDLERGAWSRLTAEANSSFPVWTPDGKRLALSSGRDGPYSIFWRPIDGSSQQERLLAGDRPNYPFSWSPDGRTLAFVSVNPKTLQDIWVLSVDSREKPRPFLETSFREGAPTFSPDGHWLAYTSDESGRSEIYVRPFPGPGEKIAISTEGGNEVVWPRRGTQLFYRINDAVMAVDINTANGTFSAGKPRTLFEKAYERSMAMWADYDVTADGQRLLMIKGAEAMPATRHINVVLNWFDELKRTARVNANK